MSTTGQYSTINQNLHSALLKAEQEYSAQRAALPVLRRNQDGIYDAELLKKYFEVLPNLQNAQISIILFSYTLIESYINFYLSLKTNASLFDSIESVSLLDKWTELPSLLVSGYKLDKSKSLYSDLKEVIKYRNQIVHPKPMVSEDEKLSHKGNLPELNKLTEKKVNNFITLPLRLIKHLVSYEQSDISFLLAITSGYPIKKIVKSAT